MSALTQFYVIFSLWALVSACSMKEVADRRTGSGAADANAVRFSVLSGLKGADVAYTSTSVHQLKSEYVLPDDLKEDRSNSAKLSVTMRLFDAKNKKIWEETRRGESNDWVVEIPAKEGRYLLVAEPSDLPVEGLDKPKAWERNIVLDFTLPKISLVSTLEVGETGNERSLETIVSIKNEDGMVCDEARLNLQDSTAPVAIALAESSSSKKRAHKFEARTSLNLSSYSGLNVYVRCTDIAGNVAETNQSVDIEQRDYTLSAAFDAEKGRMAGDTEDTYFVRPGQIRVLSRLISASDASELSQGIVDIEKSFLTLFFRENLAADMPGVKAYEGLIASLPFESSLEPIALSSLDGKRRIYVSLVRTSEGVETLLNTVALNIYVDNEAVKLEFLSKTTFSPASSGSAASVTVRSIVDGAPVKGLPSAEYSVNKSSWSALPGAVVTELTTTGVYKIDFNYPTTLTGEQPLRVRVKARDLAGYESVPVISPAIFAKPDINLVVAPAERSSCAAAASGSKLSVNLSQSFYCKRLGEDILRIPLVVQNRGSLAISLYSTSVQSKRMRYQVYAGDGATLDPVVNGSLPASYFEGLPVTNGSGHLVNVEIPQSALSKSKIIVYFDREDTGAYSSVNACYADGTNYPMVIVQDKAAGKELKASPFLCDADSAVSF